MASELAKTSNSRRKPILRRLKYKKGIHILDFAPNVHCPIFCRFADSCRQRMPGNQCLRQICYVCLCPVPTKHMLYKRDDNVLNIKYTYILLSLLFLSTESTAVAATFLNTIQHPTLTGLWTIVQLSAQRLKGVGRMSLKVSYIDDYNPKRIMVEPSTL